MIAPANYVQAVLSRLADEKPTGDLDDGLLALYALLALVKGAETTLEDVHDAWALWRNRTDPEHRSLVPFADLDEAIQELDRPYMEAIQAAARGAALEVGDGEQVAKVDPLPPGPAELAARKEWADQ